MKRDIQRCIFGTYKGKTAHTYIISVMLYLVKFLCALWRWVKCRALFTTNIPCAVELVAGGVPVGCAGRENGGRELGEAVGVGVKLALQAERPVIDEAPRYWRHRQCPREVELH